MMPRMMPARPDSWFLGSAVGKKRSDVGPVLQRDGLVVTGY